MVTVFVIVGGITTSGCDRTARKTRTAPIVRNKAKRRMAIGRLTVTSGMRLPCTTFSGFAGFSGVPKSAPHTRQRTASMATLVPQVGHNLVDVGVSGLIGCLPDRYAWNLRIIPYGLDVKLRPM